VTSVVVVEDLLLLRDGLIRLLRTNGFEVAATVDTGGVGYLLKDRVGDVRQFVEAVRRVADGGTAMDPEVISQYPRAQVPADAAGRADGQGTRGARADGRGAH
jgi:hypothetical protein